MSYLKALGVFRLVAEQADPDARLSWAGGCAVIASRLSSAGVCEFFLEQYRPTPILAPWNGGSGFYGGGAEPLEAIEKAKSPRFELYRDTIKAVKRFAPETKPTDEDKKALLTKCRSELSDEIVPWLDVCFVMGEEKASFFPLLGTGGNDGRLDFTNNFMQRLAEVLPLAANGKCPDESAGWLSSALFGNELVSLGKSAIGQFNPGGIGGANGVQGKFEADSRVNPWDYTLMIEGALLFAGAAARRLGAAASMRAVFPFSVESVAVGYGSATASEETTDGSRAELWLPLWNSAATLPEIRQLFAEGRAQLGRQQAKNAVEFSLAVSLLGVSRGIGSFARYGFLKRNGLAFLAAPLGRIVVRSRPKANLLSQPALLQWLDQLRRACSDKERTPARYQSALRGIDRAAFEFANRSEQGDPADRRALVIVLAAIGKAERTLANGLAFSNEKYLRPIAALLPEWLDQADDGSPEFSLAAALAGIPAVKGSEVGSFRTYLEPVAAKGASFDWEPSSTSAVWSRRPLVDNMIAVFKRRQIEGFRGGLNGIALSSRDGVKWKPPNRTASLQEVLAFVRGEVDDEKIESLVWSLIGLDWSEVRQGTPERKGGQCVPSEFGTLRLLVEAFPLVPRDGLWTVDRTESDSVADARVFDWLRARGPDALSTCVDQAARRLKSQGKLVMGYRNRQQSEKGIVVDSGLATGRLLAAMLFPLSDLDLAAIANAVLYPPETEE